MTIDSPLALFVLLCGATVLMSMIDHGRSDRGRSDRGRSDRDDRRDEGP